MPVNGLSVGRDVSVVFTLPPPNGVQRFSYITNFKADPVLGDLKTTGLDGRTRHGVVHEGWEGEIDFDRDSDQFDAFWANAEDAYHNGQNQYSGTITETIIEPTGGRTSYRYINVVFKLKTLGDKKANEFVKGKMAFSAERRIKVV